MKDDHRESIDIHEETAILVAVLLPTTIEEPDPLQELAALADAAVHFHPETEKSGCCGCGAFSPA